MHWQSTASHKPPQTDLFAGQPDPALRRALHWADGTIAGLRRLRAAPEQRKRLKYAEQVLRRLRNIRHPKN